MKPQPCGPGRQYRKLRAGGNPNQRVDHMVLEAFVGPRPDGTECCHSNDIQSDNRLSNLRWATHRENCADRSLNGRMDESIRKKRKAIPEEVALLRETGMTFRDIASLLNISPATAFRNLA
jgi:hypothetical protein